MPAGPSQHTAAEAPADEIRLERAPALPVLMAFAAGIAADARLALDRDFALPAAAVLLLAVFATRQFGIRAPCLLAALFCLGAAARHRATEDRSVNGIVRYVSFEPQLVRLRGRIADPPVIQQIEAVGWARDRQIEEQTRCLLECTGLRTESGRWLPATGRVQFTLAGALPHARLGDDIETLGWLRQAGSPRNPGGFDLRARDRNQGVDARLFTEHAATVHVRGYPKTVLALTAEILET